MTTETVTLFFALLAGALVAVLVALAVSPAARAQVRSLALEGAAAVAVTCTLGSLWLSEGAAFDPCRLCWVQRGFMYPAAVVLVAAAITRRRALALVGAALAVPGLAVAIFHRIEQSVGEIGNVCDVVNPCSGRFVDHFGFVTIPAMAAVGFAGILALVALAVTGDDPDRRIS